MDKKLLDILVCPVSGGAVDLAGADLIATANHRIAQGTLVHADGTTVAEPLDAALITQDRHTLYRVHDGIPVMLPEHGIEWSPDA